ncbi:hypothetical protein L1049_009166 [Liquidambar formosana]|uniref:RNase H type-1 domain-containing protein n=1 Tax=Liquidambar formosana TaxID=63359 RepID=A0AAP0S8H7_LIQFO
MGVIVRDWTGHVLAASSRQLSGVFSVVVVEAMAVRYALGLAHELGLHSVEVEGDCAEVVTALTSHETVLTSFGLIIEDILVEASQFCEMVSFCHTCREGNVVAHGLARHAQNIDDLEFVFHQCN